MTHSGRIVPEPLVLRPEDEESKSVWGFRDTAFHILDDTVVKLSGNRYDLAGQELPQLLGWVQDTIHSDVGADNLNPSNYPPPIPECRVQGAFLEEILVFLDDDQICDDAEKRLRHGHGQTQEEMCRIKYGRLERIPDLIVYPDKDEDVAGIVRAAQNHDVCLIPYGGGTNVSDALRCPEQEHRMIVSVDMGRMNRVLWIDPENRMACIQAGAVGRNIAEQLAEHGFTMGHEPDSIEFSTLGGWVATHASGMKKNRYGNIEDLVLDVTVVTPRGTLERPNVAPRESVGVGDARRWIYGSEGAFGIVREAVQLDLHVDALAAGNRAHSGGEVLGPGQCLADFRGYTAERGFLERRLDRPGRHHRLLCLGFRRWWIVHGNKPQLPVQYRRDL